MKVSVLIDGLIMTHPVIFLFLRPLLSRKHFALLLSLKISIFHVKLFCRQFTLLFRVKVFDNFFFQVKILEKWYTMVFLVQSFLFMVVYIQLYIGLHFLLACFPQCTQFPARILRVVLLTQYSKKCNMYLTIVVSRGVL